MNRDLLFLVVEGEDSLHAALALEGAEELPGEAYLEDGGKRFFYCETTGGGWRVGEIPEGIGRVRVRVRLSGTPTVAQEAA